MQMLKELEPKKATNTGSIQGIQMNQPNRMNQIQPNQNVFSNSNFNSQIQQDQNSFYSRNTNQLY
jgi:hypothetical protein